MWGNILSHIGVHHTIRYALVDTISKLELDIDDLPLRKNKLIELSIPIDL
jgi:hypothetical protein